MKIAILTATISECDFFPNIIELKKIGEKRGHEVTLLRNGVFQVLVEKGGAKLFYNNEEFYVKDYDVVLNRISVKDKHNGDYYVIEEFLKAGVKVFNTPEAVSKARNKLLSLQIISKLGFDVTKSFVVRRYEDLGMAKKYFKFPVILKNIFGSLGSSTLLVHDFAQLRALYDYLWNINRNDILLIQEFVRSDDEKIADYRVFILGNEVVSSMKRTGKDDDFRSNYKKGGSIEYAEITDFEKEASLKIASEFGLKIAGIDFIRTKNGPVFLEVNSNPGIDGIRKASLSNGFDILDKIIDFCENFVK